MPCCFHSLISTQTFRRAHVSGRLRGDKECPFSGVTAGRVWRKVPESDPRECVAPLLPKSQMFTQRGGGVWPFLPAWLGCCFFFLLQTFSLFLNTPRSSLSNKHCNMFVVLLKVDGESGAEQEYSVSKAKVRLDRAWSSDGWVIVMCSAFTRSEKFLQSQILCRLCKRSCVCSCKKITCAC